MVSISECFPRATPRRGPSSAVLRPRPAARSARGSIPSRAARRRGALSRHRALRRGRRAEHAGADRRARTASKAIAARAPRSPGCATAGRQAAQGYRCAAVRARHQPLRLRLDAPGERGQRRPQPQLRRPRQGLSEERGLPRHRRRRPAQGVERGGRPRPSACSTPTPRSTAPTACRARSAAASTAIPTASSSAATADLVQPHPARHRPRGSWPRARVGIIDFHTGLGPFGHGELIFPVPPTSSRSRVRAWYGDELTSPRTAPRPRRSSSASYRRLPAGAARGRGDADRPRVRHLLRCPRCWTPARRQLADQRGDLSSARDGAQGRHEGTLLPVRRQMAGDGMGPRRPDDRLGAQGNARPVRSEG